VADAPLVVQLVDALGAPVVGQAIDWAVTSGNATLSAPSTPTDASGHAQVTLTFGATSGAISITASTVGGATPVVFSATALDAAIGVASGDGQVAPINTTLPLPLKVQVNAPVTAAGKGGAMHAQSLAGVPVTFTVTVGGGSVAPVTVVTDAAGEASTQFTLGALEGVQTVVATVPGGASVTFNATATVTRTLAIVSGNAQAGAPGVALPNPLVVRAKDNGVDAPGETITWTVSTGSATVTANGPTNASGLADADVLLGATPGQVTIRAERADDPTVFVTFDVTAAKLQLIPGLSPEQLEVAIVIDDACAALAGQSTLTAAQADFLARCQELTTASIIDPAATTEALQSLLPGLAVAMQEAVFNAAQAQFQNLKLRIAALRSGTQGTSFQGLALTAPGGTVSLGSLGAALTGDGEDEPKRETGADFQRWGFFASGNIGRGEAEEGSTRPAYDYDINGLTVGLDYRYSDTFILGAALGYTHQDMELRGQPGTMDMSGYSVSGYATWYRDNSWYSDAVVTWGHNRFDLLRSVTYTVPTPGGGTSTIDQTARSDSDGDMLEAALTFGRDFNAKGWNIGPYGRVLYTRVDFDRIVDEMEPGAGSGLGLEIDERSLTSVASEIGAKFAYAHSTDWGVLTPHFQLEWEHEFKDDPKALTARFLADPTGTPFTLTGEEVDADYFRMSVGLSIIMTRGRSAFLLYERTVGREGFDQQNFGLGIRLEF
jgi:outer membrane autotransporter protein